MKAFILTSRPQDTYFEFFMPFYLPKTPSVLVADACVGRRQEVAFVDNGATVNFIRSEIAQILVTPNQ